MGDKGILLTVMQEGGIQLPASPEGSLFLTVTSNYGKYTIKGRCMDTNFTLLSGGMADVAIDGMAVLYDEDAKAIASGEEMTMTWVTSGRTLNVGSGGKAYSTSIFGGGTIIIHSGGSANNVTLDGTIEMGSLESSTAYMRLIGTAEEVYIQNGGRIQIDKMGVLTSANLEEGSISVGSGGIVNFLSATYHGVLTVQSGGIASNITINESAHFYIDSGGVANSITVNSGGRLYVSSGGSALAVSSGAGAGISVDDGGYIEYIS